MKICIIHLSDAHFKYRMEETTNLHRIDMIVKSLGITKDIEDFLIFFSGDIGDTGIKDNYHCANFFLKNLCDALRTRYKLDKYFNVFVVPGNHDMNYRINDRTANEIQKYSPQLIDESFVNEEPKLLEDFYIFAERHHCFQRNRILDQKYVQCGNLRIKINLLNSAPFSAKDNDKGLHYIPTELIENLYISEKDDRENVCFALTMMHHSPEWFTEEIKLRLLHSLYEGTSILFLGHEHNPSSVHSILNDTSNIKMIYGGVLGDTKNFDNSSFNAAFIDTVTEGVELYRISWNANSKIYINSKKEISKLIRKKAKGFSLIPSSDFLLSMRMDEKHNISGSFMDYFVFPRLSVKRDDVYSSDNEICESDSFMKDIMEKKKIIISGEDNAGKTTIIKFIYLMLLEKSKKIPLLFTPEDIREKSVKNIVNYSFREQYGDDAANWAIFQQSESSKKVALIDDANKIKEGNLTRLLEIIDADFDYVILCTKEELDFNVVKSAKVTLFEKEFARYRINRFFSDKRKELIKNYVKTINGNHSAISNFDVDETIKTINGFIKNQMQFFRLDPDFILQYVQYIVEGNKAEHNKYNVFNLVFENNIVNAIRACRPSNSVEIIFFLLEELAHYIHFNKKYPVGRSEFENIVNAYNEEYGEKVDIKGFYETVIEAKILKSFGDNWDVKFCNNNYLAFFVAKRINRKFNDDRDRSDVINILNNLCFGINGDIVLFLSYITQNVNLLSSIFDEAESYMGMWKEFDFANNRINFISRFGNELKVKLPDASDKERIEKDEVNAERKMQNHDVIETVDIYDYDEAEVELEFNKLIKALKYTEMIAKSLPNFSHVLKKPVKETVVKSIYCYPNKIIFNWLHEVDNHFDEIVEDIVTDYNSRNSKKITKDKIGLLLTQITISSILNLYNFIANISADKKSIAVLNSFDNKGNVTYQIQNIMMEENIGNIESFMKKVEQLFGSTDDFVVKGMLRQIVRKCLLTHENIGDSKERLLRSKYFNASQQRELLLSKANQCTKK